MGNENDEMVECMTCKRYFCCACFYKCGGHKNHKVEAWYVDEMMRKCNCDKCGKIGIHNDQYFYHCTPCKYDVYDVC